MDDGTTPLILLVEDEAFLRLALQHALEEDGFVVLTAACGRDAVAAVESQHAEIAGLITDIQLGEGPNGWEVARHARGLNPHVAVLYVTGDSAPAWSVMGVAKSHLLQKPIAAVEVISAISLALVDPN